MAKPKVLYVDDERANLTSFKYQFRQHYDICVAESAEEGYELLRQHDIPVIISDQRMPDVTGVEFLERVSTEFPTTVRMILTGYSDIDAIIQGVNRGKIYYYFSKPWDEAKMKLIIDNALEAVELENTILLNEKRFRHTFEQAAVGMAHVAPDGRFLRINQLLCDIVGHVQAELLARTLQDMTHPDDLDADLESARQVLVPLSRPWAGPLRRRLRRWVLWP